MMEFHIARKARERYKFAEIPLFLHRQRGSGQHGRLPRVCAPHEPGARRAEASRAGRPCRPALRHGPHRRGQPRAHGALSRAVRSRGHDRALDWFAAQVGEDKLDAMLLAFVEQFPGSTVIRGKETPQQWLAGSTDRHAASRRCARRAAAALDGQPQSRPSSPSKSSSKTAPSPKRLFIVRSRRRCPSTSPRARSFRCPTPSP